MPDHPPWPAELVEKAARALAKARTGFGWGVINDQARSDFQREARAVLSALSGDLVPRQEHGVALRWVGQEDAQGCGIAVLAMLTGRTYAEVKATIDAQEGHGHNGNWDTNGITHITLDRLLTAEGYFVQRRYDHWGGEWPPRPFAPVHFASVGQPSGRSHFVVMDAEGCVLDPLREGTFSLTDWAKVHNVVGLIRPEARSQADALAEALEGLRHAAFDYAQGGFQLGPARDALAAALYVADERLASHRSSSSTETEG